MKKKLALLFALIFYVSILPPLSTADLIKGNFLDITTKEGPWVDVRSHMDGLNGRCLLSTWLADKTNTDTTKAVQAAIDNSIALKVPCKFYPGTYKITDSLYVGAWGFTNAHLIGSIGSAWPYTVTIKPTFKDRPAIMVQGGRGTVIDGFRIEGLNTAPDNAINTTAMTIKAAVSDWISPGITNGKYNPYAGICVDGFNSGAPEDPADRWPNVGNHPMAQYNNGASALVMIKNCYIQYFVVGLMINPSKYGWTDAITRGEDNWFWGNTYSVSIGDIQAKTSSMNRCGFYMTHTAIEGIKHGHGVGAMPPISNSIFMLMLRMYNGLASTSGLQSSNLSEVIASIGNIGTTTITSGYNFKFENCTFDISLFNNYRPAYHITAFRGVHFDSCFFRLAASNTYTMTPFRIYSSHPTPGQGITFTNCSIDQVDDDGTKHRLIGSADGVSVFFKESAFTWANLLPTVLNDEMALGVFGGYVYPKMYFTNNVRRFYNSGALYKVSTRMNYYALLNGTSLTYNADNVTFSTTTPEQYKLDDFIYWPVLYINETPSTYSSFIPALKVTNINGATITAEKMVTDSDNVIGGLDNTYTMPSGAFVFRPQFFNNVTSTGDFVSGSALIDNVTTVANFAVGDWVQSPKLPADCRIISIVSDNVTLSKNATGTGSDNVYNSLLTAY